MSASSFIYLTFKLKMSELFNIGFVYDYEHTILNSIADISAKSSNDFAESFLWKLGLLSFLQVYA